ncbi:MAG: cation transporter [Bdellovibrio sp.]|nr:cation transporter [Methylotenera sp.]
MSKHSHEAHDDHNHSHVVDNLAAPIPIIEQHQHGNAFALPFVIILVFAAVEYFGGLFTHSLALMGDAGHMLSDAAALGMAWFASHHAIKAGAKQHKSGLTHLELVASTINCLLMLGVTVYIVVEAVERLKNPQNVAGFYVMWLAVLGVAVNLVVAKMLHHHGEAHGGHENLNHRAAFLHVLGDLLASVAALVAGAIIYFTGWLPADPILSLLICALILASTLKLANDIWRTLQNKQ